MRYKTMNLGSSEMFHPLLDTWTAEKEISMNSQRATAASTPHVQIDLGGRKRENCGMDPLVTSCEVRRHCPLTSCHV